MYPGECFFSSDVSHHVNGDNSIWYEPPKEDAFGIYISRGDSLQFTRLKGTVKLGMVGDRLLLLADVWYLEGLPGLYIAANKFRHNPSYCIEVEGSDSFVSIVTQRSKGVPQQERAHIYFEVRVDDDNFEFINFHRQTLVHAGTAKPQPVRRSC